ncbi:MAG: hypothetical protein ACPGID_08435 [Rubricella sp.]
MSGPGRGIVFVATGAGYLDLARRAAATVRACMPDIPIDLFTDQDAPDWPSGEAHAVVGPVRNAKVHSIAHSRFARSLFLDADTWMVRPVDDLFDLLDRFDIAVAHEQVRVAAPTLLETRHGFPECFPEFNTGVLGWRRCDAVDRLLARWRALDLEEGQRADQFTFRKAVWDSDVRVATLPPEFNIHKKAMIAFLAPRNGCPRIIHAPGLHRHIGRSGMRPITTLEEVLGADLHETLMETLATRDRVWRRVRRQPEWRATLQDRERADG